MKLRAHIGLNYPPAGLFCFSLLDDKDQAVMIVDLKHGVVERYGATPALWHRIPAAVRLATLYLHKHTTQRSTDYLSITKETVGDAPCRQKAS